MSSGSATRFQRKPRPSAALQPDFRLGGAELADRGHLDGARVHEELVLLDERLCDLLRVDRQLFWAAVLPDVDGDREPHAA